jgi:Maltose acetyltransferase.
MTEKEKMLSGKLYNHTDISLTQDRNRASDLMHYQKHNKKKDSKYCHSY